MSVATTTLPAKGGSPHDRHPTLKGAIVGHKVFISFKTEDMAYKNAIKSIPGIDYIDKSLTEPINSNNDDYIMSKIRTEYLHDSTVTIFLIGHKSSETPGSDEQYYIKKELQASLYNKDSHLKSGVLGVVLPDMVPTVYGSDYECSTCNVKHSIIKINDSTTISEFNYNYYIPNGKCAHAEEDRYCVLATWDQFVSDPNTWIEAAFAKRTAPIASKTKVRP